MFVAVFCVATAVLGIDVGWEPDAQGDAQYIIQVEPEVAKRMLDGRPIEFDLRPEHQGVRRFRFQVGTNPVPRTGEIAPVSKPDASAAKLQVLPTFSQTDGPPDTSADSPPKILRHESNPLPINAEKAVFNEPARTESPLAAGNAGLSAEDALLVPLVVASGTAVGLLAAFLYLCWIHHGTRRSYRTLLADYQSAIGGPKGQGSMGTPDLLSLRG
jgi:hypothetical protein